MAGWFLSWVQFPADVPHTFRVLDGPARILMVHADESVLATGRDIGLPVTGIDVTEASESVTIEEWLSGAGSSTGFTTTGSHASTATNSEGYGAESRNTWFRTEFNVGQYRGMCIGNADEQVPHQHQQGKCPPTKGRFFVHKCIWMIHSRGWSGSQTTQHPRKAPRTPRADCRKHEKNDVYHGDHGSAIKWSQGFQLAAALGVKGIGGKVSFNSTAHTGYDTNAEMSFHFGHTGYLCGTNRTEAHAAIIVQRANLP